MENRRTHFSTLVLLLAGWRQEFTQLCVQLCPPWTLKTLQTSGLTSNSKWLINYYYERCGWSLFRWLQTWSVLYCLFVMHLFQFHWFYWFTSQLKVIPPVFPESCLHLKHIKTHSGNCSRSCHDVNFSFHQKYVYCEWLRGFLFLERSCRLMLAPSLSPQSHVWDSCSAVW